jgi:hypothetical protein
MGFYVHTLHVPYVMRSHVTRAIRYTFTHYTCHIFRAPCVFRPSLASHASCTSMYRYYSTVPRRRPSDQLSGARPPCSTRATTLPRTRRSLTSDNGRAPGRMFDTLLPFRAISDAEYPAFYPIGIKASCVCAPHAPCRRRRSTTRTLLPPQGWAQTQNPALARAKPEGLPRPPVRVRPGPIASKDGSGAGADSLGRLRRMAGGEV